ncbi:MAG: glycine cleavage system aminomethyltransferase GcvT [Phycisphaerae bacterium]|nr:glycine cleavage system aminomethyltransferase GcvT [Phycisphaerae bacterium]
MNQSPLHNMHVRLGAKMVDFAGWYMPMMYRGIIEEHNYTRNAVSLFDVSHMGRLRFVGDDVEACLQRICTRNLAGMQAGQCRYSHICREDGGILDDVIVSRDQDHWLMVCNASNHAKIVDWVRKQTTGCKFELTDTTMSTAMIAIQGAQALDECDRLLPFEVKSIKRYRFISGSYLTFNYVIFRSGYTGEDGFEIVLPAKAIPLLAPKLLGDGSGEAIIKPAGLGARDTLRLEAGMPLYGHELSEQWDPLTAGQSWCVDLGKDFIGAQAIRKLEAQGLKSTIVGLELEGRRTARQGYEVFAGDRAVGKVTSGCLSPTLGKSIAMAMIEREWSDPGQALEVDFNGRRTPCRVVKLPFYKQKK